MKNHLLPILMLVAIASLLVTACKNLPRKTVQEKTGSETAAPDLVKEVMAKNAAYILNHPKISSLSIGVYTEGKAHTGHYGELDKGKNNPPTDATIYEIASVSKTFAGTLVAQAVLDGKIDLEADFRDYLKEDYPNLAYKGSPIKIKHLLTHTSSLPSDLPLAVGDLKGEITNNTALEINKLLINYSKEQFLKDLKSVELDTLPGTRYNYCNVGPDLLAYILEGIYELSFEEILDKHIWQKAGMTKTKINLSAAERKNVAPGYMNFDKTPIPAPTERASLWGADGGLHSNPEDLLKYAMLHLDKNNATTVESHRVLYEADIRQLGYFWQIRQNENDGTFYFHHGGAFGMQNWLYVYPKYDMAISVMTNISGPSTSTALSELTGGLLDDLKPFGKKSIYRAIRDKAYTDVDAGIEYYKYLKDLYPNGYTFNNEYELNQLGYQLLGQKRNADAIKVFQLLVAEFPEAANPYDSLGEAYYENGDYELSIKNYQKSIELNPENTHAMDMIKKMKK